MKLSADNQELGECICKLEQLSPTLNLSNAVPSNLSSMPHVRELSAFYHPSQHSHKVHGRTGCIQAQRKVGDLHCHPLLWYPSFKQGKFGFGSFFFASFLGKSGVSNSQNAGEVLALHSAPQLVLLLFSWHLTYTYIYRLCGFFYPFTLQETYKKYCLCNLKTLAIKLFWYFGASPEICGFSCC